MKYIIVVPDGMADWPIEELGNKTPLEAAHTKHMDYIASHGLAALVKTIPDNMPPGSDIGNLALLGYNPETNFTGRAPLEAANIGIDLADDEVVFRCNLVTLANNTMADYSAGHIQTKEAQTLIEALNKNLPIPDIKFYAGQSYRHLLVIKSSMPADLIKIKSYPPHDIIEQKVEKYLPQGKGTEILLDIMERSRAILENHPVNQVRIDLKENPATGIWLWGQGTKPQLPSFEKKFKLKGSIISAVDLVNGIGRLAGLEVIKVPGITGYYDTNYKGKAEYAIKSLKKKDFIYIHIEAPDEAGHNGDAKMKTAVIERIDREIIGAILNRFDGKEDFRILVVPDHATPVAKRTHSREPVGFAMYGKGIAHDGVEKFSETTTKEKGIKFESGEALIEYFLRPYL